MTGIPPTFGYSSNPLALAGNIGGYSSLVGIAVLAGAVTLTAAKFIPLVGIIVGIARIGFACYQKSKVGDWDKGSHNALDAHVIRGIMEIGLLSPILLIADIFVTLKRCLKPSDEGLALALDPV